MALILQPGQIVTGKLFSEPMRVETAVQISDGTWRLGLVGTQSEKFRSVTLSAAELSSLTILQATRSFSADGSLLRLGIQAYSLGIAFEFDPYFGLSISRVDPLPHQLEAIYDYMLKLARVRFLLADDAGAGKTIMAGLLLRELKLRGLADRTLVVCPANLTFQWQRELKDMFSRWPRATPDLTVSSRSGQACNSSTLRFRPKQSAEKSGLRGVGRHVR